MAIDGKSLVSSFVAVALALDWLLKLRRFFSGNDQWPLRNVPEITFKRGNNTIDAPR